MSGGESNDGARRSRRADRISSRAVVIETTPTSAGERGTDLNTAAVAEGFGLIVLGVLIAGASIAAARSDTILRGQREREQQFWRSLKLQGFEPRGSFLWLRVGFGFGAAAGVIIIVIGIAAIIQNR